MSWTDPNPPDPTWGVVTTELRDVVNELRAAGIPATDDPDLVQTMLADEGWGALVAPPTTTVVSMGLTLALEVPVHLVTVPPGKHEHWRLLWDALPAFMATLGEPATPVALSMGGTSAYPGYQTMTARTVEGA